MLGEKEKATEELINEISQEDQYIGAIYGIPSCREALEKKYRIYFDKLGLDMDYESVVDLYRNPNQNKEDDEHKFKVDNLVKTSYRDELLIVGLQPNKLYDCVFYSKEFKVIQKMTLKEDDLMMSSKG